MRIIKLFRCFQCTLVALLISSTSSAQEYQYWPALEVSERDTFIDFGMKVDGSLSGESMRFEGDKADYDKTVGQKAFVNALADYYKLARNNKVQAIRSLYFPADGSLGRYEKDVQEIPDMFSEFHKLRRVEFSDIYYWGNYVAVSMNWYDAGDNLIVPWVELFHCAAKKCLLSDRLFHQDQPFELFSVLLYLMNVHEPLGANRDNSGQWYETTYSESIQENPVQFGYKMAFLKSAANIGRTDSDKSTPLKSTDAPRDVVASINQVFGFVDEVWRLDDEVGLSRMDGASSAEEMARRVGETYSSYWGGAYSDEFIQNYDFQRSASSTEDGNSVSISQFVGVKNFTNHSLAQKVSSWVNVAPVAYVKDGKTVYVWLKVKDKDALSAYAIFAYDSSSEALVSPQSLPAGKLISNSMFAKSTVEHLIKNR